MKEEFFKKRKETDKEQDNSLNKFIKKNYFYLMKKTFKFALIGSFIGTSYLTLGQSTNDISFQSNKKEIVYRNKENNMKKKYFLFNEFNKIKRNNKFIRPPLAIDSLSISPDKYFIEINKPKQLLRVWKLKDNYLLIAQTALSSGENSGEKTRKGDSKTPSGYASIISRHESSDWLFNGRKAYGPLFFRLNQGSWKGENYNSKGRCSIGIHGTNEPEYLGERKSHGCIRVSNSFLEKADKLGFFQKDTPVYIVPENKEELFKSKHGVGRERLVNIQSRKKRYLEVIVKKEEVEVTPKQERNYSNKINNNYEEIIASCIGLSALIGLGALVYKKNEKPVTKSLEAKIKNVSSPVLNSQKALKPALINPYKNNNKYRHNNLKERIDNNIEIIRDQLKNSDTKREDKYKKITTKKEIEYENILKDLVHMKKTNFSKQEMIKKYNAFNEQTLHQAFIDYKNFTESGLIKL